MIFLGLIIFSWEIILGSITSITRTGRIIEEWWIIVAAFLIVVGATLIDYV